MSCITEILKLKGDKKTMFYYHEDGHPWIAIEGGGTYKYYEYLIVLNYSGYRCGYVAIPPENKYSKTPLDEFSEHSYDYDSLDIKCHGGLTFMFNDHVLKELLIITCSDIWVGFDCGHCNDQKDYEAMEKYFDKKYVDAQKKYSLFYEGAQVRYYDYVEQQCKSIIDQLVEKAA